jgi:hypothetical protein
LVEGGFCGFGGIWLIGLWLCGREDSCCFFGWLWAASCFFIDIVFSCVPEPQRMWDLFHGLWQTGYARLIQQETFHGEMRARVSAGRPHGPSGQSVRKGSDVRARALENRQFRDFDHGVVI